MQAINMENHIFSPFCGFVFKPGIICLITLYIMWFNNMPKFIERKNDMAHYIEDVSTCIIDLNQTIVLKLQQFTTNST
jgi:hypothetical protein